MTLSFWQQSNREPERAYDVVVVGGGVLGVSTAFWLQRLAPGQRVALVEAHEPAFGASGRNAGFLLQGATTDYATDVSTYGRDRARRLWHFTLENRNLLVREVGRGACDLEESGSMIVAGSEEEDARLREAVPLMRADRISVIYHPPDEVARRLQAKNFYGALYVSSGAMLNPVALVRHLLARSDVEVLAHHPVTSLREAGGRVVLETARRRIRASRAVLALNAYLPQVVPELSSYIRPVRAQMLSTTKASRWLRTPVYSHDGYFYVRQLPDGTCLVGGARHLHREEEVGYADEATEAVQRDVEGYLHHYFGRSRNLQVRSRWSGTMGFTPDGLPVAGTVPGCEGALWAAGFNGHGMAYAFQMGRLLAERTVGRRAEALDLFDVHRFEDAQRSAVAPPARPFSTHPPSEWRTT